MAVFYFDYPDVSRLDLLCGGVLCSAKLVYGSCGRLSLYLVPLTDANHLTDVEMVMRENVFFAIFRVVIVYRPKRRILSPVA